MAHFRYLSYVLRHKWWVLVAGLRTGAPLWRLLIHDWSKFLPAEWGGYVRAFYGRYQVGGDVEVDSFEGFGGPAVIIGRRPRKTEGGARFQIRMQDTGMETWVHDFEVAGLFEMDRAFDRAWLHHQHANPHHWQHWLLRMDSGDELVLPMPEHFLREMVADWAGAGRALTGGWEVGEWYAKNRDRIRLSDETRKRVELLLATHFGDRRLAAAA